MCSNFQYILILRVWKHLSFFMRVDIFRRTFSFSLPFHRILSYLASFFYLLVRECVFTFYIKIYRWVQSVLEWASKRKNNFLASARAFSNEISWQRNTIGLGTSIIKIAISLSKLMYAIGRSKKKKKIRQKKWRDGIFVVFFMYWNEVFKKKKAV